jgi:GAF domain-containing protein
MIAPVPENERERLAVLHGLGLLHTAPDPAFERIVRLASAMGGAEIALVTLIDKSQQWFKACVGLEGLESTPRDEAFCAHTILGRSTLWVEDARRDPRFSDNPAVTGEPHVRFYAGAPILVDEQAIGALCLVGTEPRPHDARVSEMLVELAGVAAEQCRLNRALDDGLRSAGTRTGSRANSSRCSRPPRTPSWCSTRRA